MNFSERFAPHFTHITPYIKELSSLGLHVSNNPLSRHSKEKALHYISKVGIQRFHTYFVDVLPILQAEENHQVGIDDVLRLYKLDRKLRLLTLDAIERIEVTVKVSICTHLEKHMGRHFLAQILNKNENGLDLSPLESERPGAPVEKIKTIAKGVAANARKSPELKDMRHYPGAGKSDQSLGAFQIVGKMRVAEVCEILDKRHIVDAMTVGQASKIFERFNVEGKELVSRQFGVTPRVFGDWLWRITTVRNAAAHHSRIWNLHHQNPIRVPKSIYPNFYKLEHQSTAPYRFYSTSVMLHHCLKQVARRTRWHWRLFSALDSKSLTPECMDVRAVMGFPKNWDRHDFWKGVGSTD